MNRTDQLWRNTWEAWGSGALGQFSDEYKKAAKASFADFLKGPDGSSSRISRFLDPKEFYEHEFLIGYDVDSPAKPSFVLTSRRLWVYDAQQSAHASFDLSKVVSFSFKGWWNSTAILHLNDNTVHTFKNLGNVPKDEIFRWAIDRSKQANTHLAPAVSASTTQASSENIKKDNRGQPNLRDKIIVVTIILLLLVLALCLWNWSDSFR